MSDTDWAQWVDTTSKEETFLSQSEAIIDSLNDYELMKIFGYFKFKERMKLRAVCRKWRDCVHQSFLSETTLDNDTLGSDQVPSQLLCLMITKCPNVRHIGVSFVYDSKNDKLPPIETNIVATIAWHCTQLQSIDFNVLFDTFEEWFEKEFIKYANFYKCLKKLVSRSITENAINSIIDSPNLETIDISGTDGISKPDFRRLGPKIADLNLQNSQVKDLTAIEGLCDGNGRKIKRLSIDIYDKKVLALICDSLKDLIRLKACLYSDVCDIKSFGNFKKLRSLEIETTESSRFSAQEFVGLIDSLKDIDVKELTIELSPNNNISVTDESLQEVRKHCSQIEKLVIRGANSLTGSGMYAIAQMKHIRVLDLKDCLNITDHIDIVITSCPLLRQLILHNCSYITNSTVESFIEKAKNCPNDKFLLDVIDTNVTKIYLEELSSKNNLPKNLTILQDLDDCVYPNCEHGWPGGHGSDFSGPEDMEELAYEYGIDFYGEHDDEDYYDDYEDDYGDEQFDGYAY